MVRLEGLEPPTYWFVASHSIQLSYSRIPSYRQLDYFSTVSGQMQAPFLRKAAFFSFSFSIGYFDPYPPEQKPSTRPWDIPGPFLVWECYYQGHQPPVWRFSISSRARSIIMAA